MATPKRPGLLTLPLQPPGTPLGPITTKPISSTGTATSPQRMVSPNPTVPIGSRPGPISVKPTGPITSSPTMPDTAMAKPTGRTNALARGRGKKIGLRRITMAVSKHGPTHGSKVSEASRLRRQGLVRQGGGIYNVKTGALVNSSGGGTSAAPTPTRSAGLNPFGVPASKMADAIINSQRKRRY